MSHPPIWSVALPGDAEPPFTIWVNGEPREEGTHFTVQGRMLRFTTPLIPTPTRRRFGRKMVQFAGVGVYGDHQADVVDIRYRAGDRMEQATGLPIIPPEPVDPSTPPDDPA
ncbi:MAG: hypothetical protein EXQ74_07060 [Thermoleophilia bacterium]|nr:hypothetical protein [Thermoleophilia bacterium]